jgi:P4 family phage/plasmid primase-like protien
MTTYDSIKKSGINTKDFLEKHYNIEFKNNKAKCPFHDDNTASFVYEKKKNYAHCFGCSAGGDAITLVEKLDHISNYEASKKVCDLENLHYEDISNQKELTPQELQERKETQEKLNAELQTKKDESQADEEKLRAKAKKEMLSLAPKFAQDYHDKYNLFAKLNLELFPNQSDTFEDWAHTYLGYDMYQDSIVTINRVGAEVFNIKHRNKKNHEGKPYDGKWIGHYKGSVAPFPLEYFKQHKKDTMILVEGEKDSLNLLSYDINNLTLGGVSNSWLTHKELLRDKVVYIWFDNDKAGYENAVKKYKEIQDVVKDVFIVLFYHISPAFKKGYDVSDFLAENKFAIKEDIFHAIAYSSYRLTNELIEDIGEFIDKDLSEYKQISPLKDFRDIKKEWSRQDDEKQAYNIVKVKGELDDEQVDDFLKDLSKSKREKHYETIKDLMIKSAYERKTKPDELAASIEEYEKIFNRLMDVKKILLTNYRQTHVVDIVNAFLKMAQKSGNTFGKYKGGLYVWTGTHYHYIEELEDLTTWIHNFWFFHAQVDFKKQTERNIKEVVENIISKAHNINEIRRYQENRVMNILNGTLIITKRAKILFKETHDKKDCSTNILNFEYNDKATCPKWQKFMNRVIPNKDDQATLMEFIGYCFLPSHNYEAFLFLYGKSGANGKSVIMEVIRNFFGEENTSSLQLQQFFDHQLSSLQNKLINIGTEIDTKGMDKGQLSTLKALVSPKDSIQINPKNRDPYQLKPSEKPKLINAGNDKPSGSEVDNAVFRRMLLISFDEEIQDSEKIRDLSDRFKDEMSGILNLALKSLQNLVANGKFTRSDRMKTEIEAYKDDINPIRNFVKDNVRVEKDCMVSKKMAYHFYKEWAYEKGNKPFGEAGFWKKIKEELPSINTSGKQIRYPNDFLGSDKPRFIENFAIIPVEFTSFSFNKKDTPTDSLNLDMNTKEIIIFDDIVTGVPSGE